MKYSGPSQKQGAWALPSQEGGLAVIRCHARMGQQKEMGDQVYGWEGE